MGRPKVPLIDRREAVAKALELIDRDGLDAFSIRTLGKELGVNGASLYHHFKDKDEILQGVRMLVVNEATGRVRSPKASWQDMVTKSVLGYRAALLKHPNVIPLMTPGTMRPIGLGRWDLIVHKMIDDGVPLKYCYAILDSAETLSFGSADLNPAQMPPRERFALSGRHDLPSLESAVRHAARTAERQFRLELEALLLGWSTLTVRERNGMKARA
jgi:TetR/AcrR family transcriptional regulator, tetracycline repressor protein